MNHAAAVNLIIENQRHVPRLLNIDLRSKLSILKRKEKTAVGESLARNHREDGIQSFDEAGKGKAHVNSTMQGGL